MSSSPVSVDKNVDQVFASGVHLPIPGRFSRLDPLMHVLALFSVRATSLQWKELGEPVHGRFRRGRQEKQLHGYAAHRCGRCAQEVADLQVADSKICYFTNEVLFLRLPKVSAATS